MRLPLLPVGTSPPETERKLVASAQDWERVTSGHKRAALQIMATSGAPVEGEEDNDDNDDDEFCVEGVHEGDGEFITSERRGGSESEGEEVSDVDLELNPQGGMVRGRLDNDDVVDDVNSDGDEPAKGVLDMSVAYVMTGDGSIDRFGRCLREG